MGIDLVAMSRWLAVALVLLAGCAYADVAEPLVEPLAAPQEAAGKGAKAAPDAGQQVAASVEAEAKQVEQEAAEMEKSQDKAVKEAVESTKPAKAPEPPAPPAVKAEEAPPAAADAIASSPKEANAVKDVVDAPSKAAEQMSDETDKAEYQVKLEKLMPTHPEATASETDHPVADKDITAKFNHILNPNHPSAEEQLGYQKLKQTTDKRKRERLNRDNDVAQVRSMRAQAEYRIADTKLAAAQKVLSDLHLKYANLTAEKDAARTESANTEAKIAKLHLQAVDAQKAVAVAKQAEEEAKGMRAATTVQEIEQDAEAGAGGSSESLERSKERRAFNNEQLEESKNASIAATKDAEEKQDAVNNLELTVQNVDAQRQALNAQMHAADHKFAAAKYDIEALQVDIRKAEETVAQSEAIAQISKQHYEAARKAAQAAKDSLTRSNTGIKEMVTAEALDPELAQETAVKEVMDKDGLGDNGEALVAQKGEVSRQFERLWKSMPMPNPNNPLLDAVSRAAVKDPALPKDMSPN